MPIEVRHPVNPVVQPYITKASLDFESGSTQSLSMTDANFGAYDRSKFAVSLWFKLESAAGATSRVFYCQSGASDYAFDLGFNAGVPDQLTFITSQNGLATAGQLVTTATFTDTLNWHHLLAWYDVVAAAGSRLRMFFDGTEISSFVSEIDPTAAVFDSVSPMNIGIDPFVGAGIDGLIAHPAFFSGTNPLVSTLITGTPGQPKDLTGLSGLFSWNSARLNVVDDEVLGTDWTNNNGVVRYVSDYP